MNHSKPDEDVQTSKPDEIDRPLIEAVNFRIMVNRINATLGDVGFSAVRESHGNCIQKIEEAKAILSNFQYEILLDASRKNVWRLNK